MGLFCLFCRTFSGLRAQRCKFEKHTNRVLADKTFESCVRTRCQKRKKRGLRRVSQLPRPSSITSLEEYR